MGLQPLWSPCSVTHMQATSPLKTPTRGHNSLYSLSLIQLVKCSPHLVVVTPSRAAILLLKNNGQEVLPVHAIHSCSEYEFLQAFGIALIHLLLENLTCIGLRRCLYKGNSEFHPDETMCGLRSAGGAAKLWSALVLRSLGLRVM